MYKNDFINRIQFICQEYMNGNTNGRKEAAELFEDRNRITSEEEAEEVWKRNWELILQGNDPNWQELYELEKNWTHLCKPDLINFQERLKEYAENKGWNIAKEAKEGRKAIQREHARTHESLHCHKCLIKTEFRINYNLNYHCPECKEMLKKVCNEDLCQGIIYCQFCKELAYHLIGSGHCENCEK